jgi:hypothetical protein
MIHKENETKSNFLLLQFFEKYDYLTAMIEKKVIGIESKPRVARQLFIINFHYFSNMVNFPLTLKI